MENKEIKPEFCDEFSHKLGNLVIRWIGGDLDCSLDELYERINELYIIYIEKELERRK